MQNIHKGTATLSAESDDLQAFSLIIHSIEEDGIFHEDIPITLQELQDIHFVLTQFLKLYL